MTFSHRSLFLGLTLSCCFRSILVGQGPATSSFPVTIVVDARQPLGELKPVWRFFGADEPNYATMKDGKKLIGELGHLGGPTAYFRAHSLLVTGDGTASLKWGSTNAYTEDAQGKPVYDWTIIDHIFDTYLQNGMKPYAQIGFMPQALSVKPEPYKHHWTPTAKYDDIFTGWAYPPTDYNKWGELVYQWAKHSVERYGAAEVERWYWEVWNEPNIGYWRGTPEEFLKLHDYAVAAVRRALPTAKVGGADTAGSGGKFLKDFLEHCLRGKNFATGETGTPIDFISFHAKGSPKFVADHVEMGIASQVRTIDDGFRMIASFPELKAKPIVIGESDPDGCAACQGPQLGYRNTTLYSSYTVASLARQYQLADKHGVNLEGSLTWAFEFEDQAYFAGFRVLATNGIDLPILNVFRMFGHMNGQRVAVRSSAEVPLETMIKSGVRGAPDVSAIAALESKRLSLLVWHYHDDDVEGPAADVDLAVDGLPDVPAGATVQHYRIDDDHSNAFTVWKQMGSPQKPSADQYAKLEAAGQLAQIETPSAVKFEKGHWSTRIQLPRRAVSLVVVSWK